MHALCASVSIARLFNAKLHFNNENMVCPVYCVVLKSRVPDSDVAFLQKLCFAPLTLFLT